MSNPGSGTYGVQLENGNAPSSDIFAAFLDNTDLHFFLLDRDLKIRLVPEQTRQQLLEVFGIELSYGMAITDLLHPHYRQVYTELLQEVLEGESRSTEAEVRVNEKSKHYLIQANHVSNANGECLAITVSITDITERKEEGNKRIEAEKTLEITRDNYRHLFEYNPLPCWIYDATDYRFLEVNQAAVDHYGYTREEFLCSDLLMVHPVEFHAKLKERLQFETNQKHLKIKSWQHKLKNGKIAHVDLRISAVQFNGQRAKLVLVHDFTEILLKEEELKKSNERIKLISKASSEALWEWDFISKQAYISEAYTKMTGWSSENFRQFDAWEDYIHPADKNRILTEYGNAVSDPAIEDWEGQYRYRKSDGNYAYVSDHALFIRNEHGMAIKVIGAMRDITAQKLVEEDLRKSNERFILASRAASDAIYEWNLVDNTIYWGEGIYTLFGHQPEDVTIAQWESMLHPADKLDVLQSLLNTLGQSRKQIWKHEYRLRKSDGSYSYVLERGFIIRDAEGNATRMIGSLQDLTERHFNEELLSLERSVFELSSNPDLELGVVANELLQGIEELNEEALTTLIQLKEDGLLEVIAAPSLPHELVELINGSSPDMKTGACSKAISQNEIVVETALEDADIAPQFSAMYRKHGFMTCWSFPIMLTGGRLFGCFDIYFRQSKEPDVKDTVTFERFQKLLKILIENRWALQEIKKAHERFDIIMEATHDLIWDWNLNANYMYRDSRGLAKVYGMHEKENIQDIRKWMERIHPEDREHVTRVIGEVLRSTDQNNFDVEYRFRADDGLYKHVYDRGAIIRDEEGKPIRMIGAAQDISERKRLEDALIQSKLEHQKAINLATVETQEQERAEIGKELHDNVNQVLTTTKLYLDLAGSSPEMKDELIRKSVQNITNVINEIRQLSRSLMDPSIGDLGLIDSINDLIENINLTKKLQVTLTASTEIEAFLSGNQKLTIFRIIQETLNNAIRHSQAANVKIAIDHQEDSVEVSIEDDGIGFDKNNIRRGAGLKNIENRIYLINGSHRIETYPNKGTKIIINFPINKATD